MFVLNQRFQRDLGLFFLVFILVGNVVWGNTPQYLSNSTIDSRGVGAAIIGDTIDYYVTFISSSSPPLPDVIQVQPYNTGSFIDMTQTSIIGNVYQYTYTYPALSAGTWNGIQSPYRFLLKNVDGPTTVIPTAILSTVLIDNQPPVTNGAMAITLNGGSFSGQTIRRNDVLVFTQDMTAAFQAGETADIDLNDWSLGTFAMTSADPHVLGGFTITTPGIDLSGNIYFQARDPNGNFLGPIAARTGVLIDTDPPVITSAVATPIPAGTARPGGSVQIDVTLAVADTVGIGVDKVTVTNAALNLNKVSLSGTSPNFTGTFIVPPSPPAVAYVGISSFSIEATDNGGNVTTGTSTIFSLDNHLLPATNGPMTITYNGGAYTGQTIRRNDILTFSQPMTAATFQAGETADIDMTEWTPDLGTYTMTSANPHVLTNFSVNVDIDDNTSRNIKFSATDPNGNTMGPIVARSGVVIDTISPAISTSSVTVTGNGRPSDQVTVTVTLATADGDTVTVTNSTLGLNKFPIASTTPGFFTGTFIIASSPTATAFNGITSFTFEIRDNGLNLASGSSPTFYMDNRLPDMPPTALASYTENRPPIDGIAIIGDTLKIWATATWDPGMTVNVYADLSPIGGTTQIGFTRSGTSSYSLPATYTISEGISEDSVAKNFRVWAVDSGSGNTIEGWTTPFLYIDNLPPKFVSSTITKISGTGASYRPGDQFRIRAQVNNLIGGELGTAGGVSAGLLKLGNTYTATEMLGPDSLNPGWFQGDFTIGNFDPATGWDSNSTVPTIYLLASDAQGNFGTSTVSLGQAIDNEPPVIASLTFDKTHNWFANEDYQTVRIWDTMNFHVQVASWATCVADLSSIQVDLSQIGGNSAQNMTSAGNGWYDWTHPNLATGTINRKDIYFPVKVTDNNGNQAVSSFTIFIDNTEPKVSQLNLNLTYIPGKTDSLPTVVNLNKNLSFTIPLTLSTPDDHATGSIDLIYVGGSATQTMGSDSVNYFYQTDTGSPGTNIEGPPGYQFTANVEDISGNHKVVQTTSGYTVDCYPPSILSATASIAITGATETASIGTNIYFIVHVANNETVVPTIDLTNIGGSAGTIMNPTSPAGWYDYTATVATGALDGSTPASWVVTVRDNVENTVSTFTSPVTVDSVPPQGSFSITVTVDANGNIYLGQPVTFTVSTSETSGTATIDLSMIGFGTSVNMPLTAGVNFTLATTTIQTSARYLNASFSAWVTDANGNGKRVFSAPIPIVDCQPPTFGTTHGIYISQTNGDNPTSAVANTNDVITVFASVSAYLDATPTARITTGTLWLTEIPLTYVSARNRHEGSFVIPGSPPSTCPLNLDALDYALNATDTVGNVATEVTGISTFTVKNILPTLASFDLYLSPNVEISSFGGNLVYNVGSGAVGYVDKLWASATLANGETISSVSLDLSAVGGPSAYSTGLVKSGSVASTSAGIDLRLFPLLDFQQVELAIKLYDQAGNPAIGSKTFWIDTKLPAVSRSEFQGTILMASFSEIFENLSTDTMNWSIVGSGTIPFTNASLTLDATDNWTWPWPQPDNFQVTLSLAHRQAIAKWDSTPIYLVAVGNATPPLTDQGGNWLPNYNSFPITITDSGWREPARISSINLTQTWPASIALNFTFDKNMATGSLDASGGVLLFNNLGNEYNQVDYTVGYVFQPGDTPTWIDPQHLQFIMSDNGRDWIARKIKVGTGAKTLKFATRLNRTFAKDDLDRPMETYSSATGSTVIIGDNRPSAPYFIYNVEQSLLPPPTAPLLDLGSRTLWLQTSDRSLLFSANFRTLEAVNPTMGLPFASNSVTTFNNKVELWDTGGLATSAVLTLKPASATLNPDWASTTMTLELTDADFSKVLSLFRNQTAHFWQLKVNTGGFQSLWSQDVEAYQLYNPGNLRVTNPTVLPASFVALAVSDPPPTKSYPAGGFAFEFEFQPAYIGTFAIPIASDTPAASIASGSTTITTGVFQGWTTRTVGTMTRYIARFTNDGPFPDDMQLWDVTADITGVTDAFGNSITTPGVTMVYDSSKRVSTMATGFSAASTTFIVDTASPTVIAFNPNDFVPLLATGTSYFQVDFSEPLDPAVGLRPILTLATTGYSIAFTLTSWSSNSAIYSNDRAITPDLPNGTWTFSISGGQDIAGNGVIASSAEVQVRTDGPNIDPSGVSLLTIQRTIDPALTLTDRPFSTLVLPEAATLTFIYQSTPLNLPHIVRYYNATNTLMGTGNVNFTGPLAGETSIDSALALLISPQPAGPATFTARIRDAAGNETGILHNIVLDTASPSLDFFQIQSQNGIGTLSSGVFYYNPAVALINLRLTCHASNATDALRLAAYSQTGIATLTPTPDLTQSSVGTYTVDFGLSYGLGTYTLSVADAAGNLHTGTAPLTLQIEATQPAVLTISPQSPPNVQGPGFANGATFTVTFSEPMDSSVMPTLELGNGVSTITMTIGTWSSTAIATTVTFLNSVAILNPAFPTGTYTFLIAGGRDRAGNLLDTNIPAAYRELYVQTSGPTPNITIYTAQPEVFVGIASVANNSFSPLVSPGIATFSITDNGYQSPGDHVLMILNGATQVGTLTFTPPATPGNIEVGTSSIPFWTTFEGGASFGPATYSIRLRDQFGNESPYGLASLTFDSLPATLISFNLSDGGHGITSDSVRYYSPRFGNASISLGTTATDPQRLVITASGSTTPTDVSCILMPAAFQISTGSGLIDNRYIFNAVDLAGNPVQGTVTSITVQVDSASPTVLTASPAVETGLPEIGNNPIGSRTFEIAFNEPMNPASTPVANLITTGQYPPATITLHFESWNGPTTAIFSNESEISITIPQGTWTYQVTGATDLAGNKLINLASGDFNLQIRSTGPNYVATLISMQTLISTFTPLIDQPFSPSTLVPPSVATISIQYLPGPFGVPHQLLVYDQNDALKSSIPVSITGNYGTSTVSATAPDFFFGIPDPGLTGPTTFSIRIQDTLGNISSFKKTVVYDADAPNVSSFSLTNVSDATPSQTIFYYNDQIQGAIKFAITTSATDSQRLLVASGTATTTFTLTPTVTPTGFTTTQTLSQALGFSPGTYGITMVDMAGNFATGTAWAKTLIIDRTKPTVATLTSLPPIPLYTLASGAATFTVTFSEPMNMVSATPTLSLSTGTQTIPCSFMSWANPTQALFVNGQAINESLPQGFWNTNITGTDLAKNPVSPSTHTVEIKSRGPIVASFAAYSHQFTTASEAGEILLNKPFSFNVSPNAATLSIRLTQPPASTPVSIVFTQAGIEVASFQVPFDLSNIGTFTWDTASGPIPAAPTTYLLKLVDGFGNTSRESYSWTEDALAPIVANPVISGGIIGTDTVYFNPALQGSLGVAFDSLETSTPLLRVRGANTTDTYQMAVGGNIRWVGNFDGRHSRGSVPKPVAPDGMYIFDLVDAAGNVGQSALGGAVVATGVLDTVGPIISTYSTLVNGQPRGRFAPAAASLAIVLTTAEPLTATGVFWLEVRTDANTYVNRLPLLASGAQSVAWWDGTKADGSMAIDGVYRFYAMDFTRNTASSYVTVFAITSPFRLLSATQVTSQTVDLVFNHDVDPNSLPTAVISVPGQGIATITLLASTKLELALLPGLQHGNSYTITIAPGTLISLDGAAITAPNNSATLIADAKGPVLTGVGFQGLVGQKDFQVFFDEKVTLTTAQNINNYRLETGATPIPISNAIITSDQRSVILSSTVNLNESQWYLISAIEVEDAFQNKSLSGVASWSFQGRDLTPPNFDLAAFSNPGNEFDLVVVARSNEPLQAAPNLRVVQSGGAEIQSTMVKGSTALSYMAGIHLNPDSRNATLVVTGTDLSGNTGTKTESFTVAYITASVRTLVKSTDGRFTADFGPGSLKKATLVTILPHNLDRSVASANSRIALPPVLGNLVPLKYATNAANAKNAMKSMVFWNKVIIAKTPETSASSQATELVSTGLSYELGLPAGRLTSPVVLSILASAPSVGSGGIALFRYEPERAWVFMSGNLKNGSLVAQTSTGGLFAVLRDRLAPRITLLTNFDPETRFKTAQPRIEGKVEEFGSGLDSDGLSAIIDDGPQQQVLIQTDTSFRFLPLAPLTGGNHSLTFQVKDRAGNIGKVSDIRFAVAVPLQIGEIVTYPNPASRKAVLRISANRNDISEEMVQVKLYDIAGHKVRTLTGVKPVKESWGVSSRFLYDIPWDLSNENGDEIANGVYIARIVLTDPDNSERRIKQSHKIAVLR
ncbi:hypothetical protein AUK22_11885 [bacterium CG2_30_54_10]|nr:MAG: hypothetical protein AUK22_11885 [bacterium CG2_30_54_10]